MYSRIIDLPKQSFFLFGARGTGKTSLLRNYKNWSLTIDFLSQENFFKYAQDPGLLRRQLEVLRPGSWVWIDEIQRLPELLNEVHWAIESKKIFFALSGSSTRKLRRAGVNLLAGRALSKHLYPFLPEELGRDFKFDESLRYGTIPLIHQSSHKKTALQTYASTYLKEEIQSEALVKDVPSFARFMKVAALLHGQVLNLSNVARDVGVKRSTVENYFSILDDTLLAYRLEASDSQIRIKERRHPKFYWLDAGIVSALRNTWGEVSDLEKGHLFEGFVLNMLRAHQAYRDAFDDLAYWASDALEVDFLVRKNAEMVAIEVKTGDRVRTEDLKGLRAIKDLKSVSRRVVVYPKIARQATEDGIEFFSLPDFSALLAQGKLFKRS